MFPKTYPAFFFETVDAFSRSKNLDKLVVVFTDNIGHQLWAVLIDQLFLRVAKKLFYLKLFQNFNKRLVKPNLV